MITVISLGGSIVAPDRVDEPVVKDLISLIRMFLEEESQRRFILVVGGGGPARIWQQAYRSISGTAVSPEQADWIGIMATRLNAELIRGILGPWCTQAVVTDPTQAVLEGRVLVAAGWKPGFSSDYDAVLLAERFKADKVINLSNIERIYTDEPRTHPEAKPIDTISWAEFRTLVGDDEWVPGKHVPFDPIASRHAAHISLPVICAAGRNLENVKKILRGESFIGTTIGPL
ncbi:MAG: UMP kinase [Treponema sp.]|jgi:uridylate kinase|nr:UMP kinase [Treponema sp.]